MPALYHLTPPISRSLVQITRFAPLQADPERFDIGVRTRHDWRYEVMFSAGFLERSGLQLDNYVYCFERTFDTSPQLDEAHRILVHQVEHWKTQHRTRDVMLYWELTPTGARFTDSRFGPKTEIDVDHVTWRVYEKFDRNPHSISDATRELIAEGISADIVEEVVAQLTEARLVWREGRQALGLAIPAAIARAHAKSGWKKEWVSLRP